MPLYKEIAGLLKAMDNCEQSGNHEWKARHKAKLYALIKEHMPSGSGFDAGTKLEYSSTTERIRLITSFHHMDESGGYDGWTEHVVTVRPSLLFDIVISVSGRDKNGIKDYIAEVFGNALMMEVSA